MYEITYETDTTPITQEIEADDPYTACFILGKKTTVKKSKIMKIVYHAKPDTIWKAV